MTGGTRLRTGKSAGFHACRWQVRSAPLLYGRQRELSIIAGLLDGARDARSAALVIRGDPGVGKSALLEEADQRATGMQVLRGRGVESEAQLPFAALHQVVRPILGYVDDLPEPQAVALSGALGLVAGGGDDRFLVSLAVLSLLSEAAERRPLVCLIDDAHWLDDASADALVFAARRLEAEGIVMLFATRDREVRRFEPPGLDELRLRGLEADAASALLDHHTGLALTADARAQLIEATSGNPLALLELPAALTPEQLTGREPLLTPLPVSARVERAFLTRVRRLPQDTQTILLVAAADDTGDLMTVLRAAAQLGAAREALDAADDAGLVYARPPKIEFHHPLVRSAVYHGAALSERLATHRALATVLDGEMDADRRAWHRAAASVEPDPAVVEELEQAARRARRRSGFAAASLAFERAAALTRDPSQRARSLTAAAENAWFGGRAERARLLLERARPLTTDPIERADIDRYRGAMEMTNGVPSEGCQLLLRAASEVAPLDGDRGLELLNMASVASVYAGDSQAAVAIADLAHTLTVADDPLSHMLLELLIGVGAFFQRDYATASTRLSAAQELEEKHGDVARAAQPEMLVFAGRASIFLGDDDSFARIHRLAADRARAAGALPLLAQILPRLSQAELWSGHWASASAHAREGLHLAREMGQHNLVAYALIMLALVAAHRGDDEECRSLVTEGREMAVTNRFTLATELADWTLVLLALARGQADDAYRHATEITTTGVHFWSVLDRVESAVRTGEMDTARAWLGVFEPWGQRSDDALARILHCRALLAEDDGESKRLFREALDAHERANRPYERARTELALGERLRRARRRVEAREHLRAALVAFEALGAALWAERARMELRASGQTARRRDVTTIDQLTTQELQIARYVAQGLSNRDVAAHLFLSPRTVAFHLRNVFRKLGISSRTELANLDLGDTDHAS
jgi:DNA-binding CsgD family transcriptional regulator